MNNSVYSLAVFGGELYAGGNFTTAGGNAANYIAKWNGTSWSAVGVGMSDPVSALAVYNGELYVAGWYGTISKWNGASWSAVGTGCNSDITALAVYGVSLYAGGWFTTAGGNSANHIAKWSITGVDVEENALKDNNISVFPNPANEEITINLPVQQTLINIKIYDNTGKLLQVHYLTKFSISALSAGQYLVIIQTEKNTITKKITIL